MDSVVVCALLRQRGRRCALTARERRKKLARRHRMERFSRKQIHERLCFAFIVAFNLHTPTRSLWAKERSSFWWDHIVNRTFCCRDWLENFRISQMTFLYVCNEISSTIKKADTAMRNAIPVEQRVALTLWFLATNADYRTIGHLFGVSKSTVCIVMKEVCAAIVKHLLPQYIRIPTGDGLRTVVNEFDEKLGFPQCAGVVARTHIPIASPEECLADYFNRKGWHSILMQGMVDHMGRFSDIYIGWPGRVHDARVFVNSSLYIRGTLLPDWKQTIDGKEVPLVVLGDPAYPLLSWLMKAFPDNGSLTAQQKTYN